MMMMISDKDDIANIVSCTKSCYLCHISWLFSKYANVGCPLNYNYYSEASLYNGEVFDGDDSDIDDSE